MENFEIIVRGLVIRGGKILVCKVEDRDYYFLPGGHVEFGENMRKALYREFDEELGVKPKSSKFIGTVENIFLQNGSASTRRDESMRDGKLNHEINFIFETEITDDFIEPKEDHITFNWLTPFDITEEKFVPPALRDAILKWISDKKPFFILTEEEDSLEF